MRHKRFTSALLSAAVIAVLVSGCGAIDKTLEGRKVNYKSAGKLPPLDVPPDLTTVQADERYMLPDVNKGVVTASGVAAQQSSGPRVTGENVLPRVLDAKMERSGSQRWLVVNKSPEELWPVIKEFWLQSGFTLKIESADVGLLETDWSENRAKIPMDGIRKVIGKVFDGLYSSGELDKYRTRIERTANGTEIYISHRGQVETYTNSNQEKTIWQPRPTDPELEAEFLGRLLVKLGAGDAQQTKQLLASANGAPPKANLVLDQNGLRVVVSEQFDRAWRRVGLALDRVGFAVEDRDRANGIYYVRYIDPELDRTSKKPEKGFFAGLFDRTSDVDKQLKSQAKYRILVEAMTQGTNVSVQTGEGRPEQGEVGKRILNLLQEELK